MRNRSSMKSKTLMLGLSALIALTAINACSQTAFAGSSNHRIDEFRYSSCGSRECVLVTAKKAWISALSGGFSTSDEAEFSLLTLEGKLKSIQRQVAVSYNPMIDAVTYDRHDGSFAVYSLREESLSSYGGGR